VKNFSKTALKVIQIGRSEKNKPRFKNKIIPMRKYSLSLLLFYLFQLFFTMQEGVVKFFNEAKGFGFIKSQNGEEIFVHVTGLIDKVRENDRVTFEVQSGRKGLNAVNVKLV
jgi:CspA family cold shock protein